MNFDPINPCKLVICEKPSVAQSIAKVLGATERKDGYLQGGGYIVSWCVGHLVGLCEDAAAYGEQYGGPWAVENLPIIPQQWRYEVYKDKKKQFSVLANLMKDSSVSSIVCATDAGREGELIFRYVYEQAKCTKPFERLWISSMEDSAIKGGFANLKDGHEYDNLYHSALCRAKADWLVGINATRLFSVLYDYRTLRVGRVLSPTLAMLVQRDKTIREFTPQPYFHTHIRCGDINAISKKMDTMDDAEQIKAACDGGQAVCVSVEVSEKAANPPKLYDLTSLQREANRVFAYTAQQTLDYVQALYEKKLATYPRTDSQYLTEDMRESTGTMVTLLLLRMPFSKGISYTPDINRVINNAKVSDHHAILPTSQIADFDLSGLPKAEQDILLLIAQRLLCATGEKHTFDTVKAVFECGGLYFTAKGKTVKRPGWKLLEQRFKEYAKGDAADEVEPEDEDEYTGTLPPMTEGQRFDGVLSSISEHTTTPPRPYTEDTILSAMEMAGSEDLDKSEEHEKKGIGTPATRAETIEKMIKSGYAVRKGRRLSATDIGANLVAVLPDALTSPKLTAEWENALTQIAKGAMAPGAFMTGIAEMTKQMVQGQTIPGTEELLRFKTVIGKCPRCGAAVCEGQKTFHCLNNRAAGVSPERRCGFVMWKNDRFFADKKKTLTAAMAAELLETGKTAVRGLYSSKGKKNYDAVVLLADTGGKYVNFKLDFKG